MEQFNLSQAVPEQEKAPDSTKPFLERFRKGASSKLKMLTAAMIMSMGVGALDAKAENMNETKDTGDIKSISLENAFSVGSPTIRAEDEPEVIKQIQDMFAGLSSEELGQLVRNPNVFVEIRGSSDEKLITGSGIDYVNDKGLHETIKTNAELTAKRLEGIQNTFKKAVEQGIDHPKLGPEADKKLQSVLLGIIEDGRIRAEMPPGGVLTRDQLKRMYPQETATKTDAEIDDMARYLELAVRFESYDQSIDKIVDDMALYDNVTFLMDVSGSMKRHYDALRSGTEAKLSEIPKTTDVSVFVFGDHLISKESKEIASQQDMKDFFETMNYVKGEVSERAVQSLISALEVMPTGGGTHKVHEMTDEALQAVTLSDLEIAGGLALQKGIDVRIDMHDRLSGAFSPITLNALEKAITDSFKGVRPDVVFTIELAGGKLVVSPDVSSGRTAEQVSSIVMENSN